MSVERAANGIYGNGIPVDWMQQEREKGPAPYGWRLASWGQIEPMERPVQLTIEVATPDQVDRIISVLKTGHFPFDWCVTEVAAIGALRRSRQS